MAVAAMSDEASAALLKAQHQVTQRRLKLKDFFSDFDRLRAGRITAGQFRRVLTTNGVVLSEAEMQALVGAFALPTAASLTRTRADANSLPEVNYLDFLSALQPLSQPLRATNTGSAMAAAHIAARPLAEAEEAQLRPVMAMLQHAVRTRNLSLLPPFKDLDPLHTGKVTASQFARCIPFHTLDAEVLRLFEKKYGDGAGYVYYRLWCRDIDPSTSTNAAAAEDTAKTAAAAAAAAANVTASAIDAGFAPAFFGGSCKNAELTSEQLIRILREQFALYRLRCEDYLRDFDPFNTGIVLASQFESALGRLQFVKFALTPENVQTLVRTYAVLPDAEPRADITDTPSAAPSPAAALVRINYRSFLFDTNPKNFACVAADGQTATNYFTATHATNTFLTSPTRRASAERVLEQMRRLVKANRIFLSPVLRDFDRVRKAIYEHRTCTKTRFARALATYNLLLPPPELEVLVQKYTIPHADGSPSEEVNYYQFVQDVDPSQAQPPQSTPARVDGLRATRAASQMSGTQQAGHNNNDNDENNNNYTTTTTTTVTGGEATAERPATALDEVLVKIARQAAERELRVAEFFIDFDALRSGCLQAAQFVTALGIAGLQLQGNELDLLTTAYADAKLAGFVRVEGFLRDVGAYLPQAVPAVTLRGCQSGNTTAAAFTLSARAGQAASARPPATAVGAHGSSDAVAKKEGSKKINTNDPDDDDDAMLQRLLQRLRHDTKAHSALLTPFFADFDRSHAGKISRTNFVQALARHRFALSEAETDLLCATYATQDDPSRIRYHRFVADVGCDGEGRREPPKAAPLDTKNTATSASAAVPQGEGGSWRQTTCSAGQSNYTQGPRTGEQPVSEAEVQAVVDKICAFLQTRQPRLKEFFPDGDELRHGHVTTHRFRHCLSILGPLNLTPREYEVLEAAFECPTQPTEVNYPAFIATVSQRLKSKTYASKTAALTDKALSNTDTHTPSAAVTSDNMARSEGNGQSDSTASNTLTGTQTQALWHSTMQKIKRALLSHRTTSLPAFREYDRMRKGRVTEGQFHACLIALGVRLSPDECAVLNKMYATNTGEVEYVRFAAEVDEERKE